MKKKKEYEEINKRRIEITDLILRKKIEYISKGEILEIFENYIYKNKPKEENTKKELIHNIIEDLKKLSKN